MKPKISCIIVDDESDAIEFLADSLNALYDNIDICGTYTSWKKAINPLRENNFDLLFMDISMPQKNGMDLLRLIPELRCELIFVTAYSEFAVEAFNFSACGYVLKPVKDAELTRTVDRAIERITARRAGHSYPAAPPREKNKIGVPNNRGIDYIDVNDILYLEATRRYTKVVKRGNEILSSYSIGKFKKIVENSLFYQVHRSFIVNLNCITRYKSIGSIVMSNGCEIPVSRSLREDFLKIFDSINMSRRD